jgi:hypothetical protein
MGTVWKSSCIYYNVTVVTGERPLFILFSLFIILGQDAGLYLFIIMLKDGGLRLCIKTGQDGGLYL